MLVNRKLDFVSINSGTSTVSLKKGILKKDLNTSSKLNINTTIHDVIKDKNTEVLKLLNKSVMPELRKMSPKETETLVAKLFQKDEKKEMNKQKLLEESVRKENKECTFQPEINSKDKTPPRKLEEFLQEQSQFSQKIESKVKSVYFYLIIYS